MKICLLFIITGLLTKCTAYYKKDTDFNLKNCYNPEFVITMFIVNRGNIPLSVYLELST